MRKLLGIVGLVLGLICGWQALVPSAKALTSGQEAVLFKKTISPAVQWNASQPFPSAILSHTRTSNATMFDSTGALTYAPNNILTYSNTFSNAAWSKVSATVSSGVSDPYGGTNAWTLTATGVNGNVQRNITVSSGDLLINTFWAKRRSGTGNVVLYRPDAGAPVINVTSDWQQFYVKSGPTGTTAYIGILLATSGDEIDIYAPTQSFVTYEPTLRSADQVITTSAAYYGPRISYDPVTLAVKGLLIEESRTNLLLNSKADGTSLSTQSVTVTAQPYTLTFYGTGSITLSGASTAGPLSGSGAFPTRSTLTFTPSAGTLTLTVSGTVQYAQLEAGSVATSFIPTGASSAIRGSDIVKASGTMLTALQGASASIIVETTDIALNSQAVFAGTTLPSYLYYGLASAGPVISAYNAAGGMLAASGSPALTSPVRIAAGWSAAGRSLVYNGGTVVSDANVNPSPTDVYLGNLGGAGRFINGHIKSFAVYNQRLPDVTLKAKSVVGASYAANDNGVRFAFVNDNVPVQWRLAL